MKKWVFMLLFGVIAMAVCGACVPRQEPVSQNIHDAASGRISIVTTIFPLYDFARAVAGDKADLVMLVDPGTEIHSYDPAPADIIKIQEAKVFIYIGGENDAWVETILSSIDTKDKKIVRLLDYVDAVREETVAGMQSDGEKASAPAQAGPAVSDEHIWTSPRNAVLMVRAIAQALAECNPPNQALYHQNALAYEAKIEAVDQEIGEIVKNSSRRLLVFGDRFPFRYLADEFGLEYRAAFNGCSSETEVSAATLAYLIDTVKENKLPYVYYIEMSNQNIARSISEQTGAGLLLLHSCQSISKADFEAGATYVSLMEQNAANLKQGLN